VPLTLAYKITYSPNHMNFFNSKSLTERHIIVRWKAKALVLLKTLNVASESKYRLKAVLYGRRVEWVQDIKRAASVGRKLPVVYYCI